ncbi:hypothetical protein ACFCZ5_27630 [Streptomyces microflavus]|uniref:hypothetical protein n=1 Tax=Streptomyces microflavus TaxID=1919 RepID=UPI0035DD34D7
MTRTRIERVRAAVAIAFWPSRRSRPLHEASGPTRRPAPNLAVELLALAERQPSGGRGPVSGAPLDQLVFVADAASLLGALADLTAEYRRTAP